jgi:hypothetical protein
MLAGKPSFNYQAIDCQSDLIPIDKIGLAEMKSRMNCQ